MPQSLLPAFLAGRAMSGGPCAPIFDSCLLGRKLDECEGLVLQLSDVVSILAMGFKLFYANYKMVMNISFEKFYFELLCVSLDKCSIVKRDYPPTPLCS